MRGFFKAAKEFLKKETWKKYLTVFAVLLVLVSLLEVFLFNYRHFESLSFEQIGEGEYEIANVEGMSFKAYQPDVYTVLETGGGALTFSELNKEIKNIKVYVRSQTEAYTKMSVYFTDKGNENLFGANYENMWTVHPDVARSQYKRTHFSEETETIRLVFHCNQFETIQVNVSFNAVVPFSFSFLRAGGMTLLVFALYCLRPSSALWKLKLLGSEKRYLKIAVCAVLLVAQIVAFRGLTTSNRFWMAESREYDTQYHRAAEALASGQVHLKDAPPQWLLDMENPYDTNERTRLENETGEIALWDHAFYNGRYYSYFGVLPALVYYLPYYLVTGSHAPNYFGVFLCLAAFSVFAMLLLYEIVRRWFKETSFLLYLILSVLFINTAGTIYIAHRPDFYSFPIVLSLALTVGGLYFWIASKRNGKHRILFLLLGSFFIALNALSRPQFLIAALLAFPLFWDDVFKGRLLFSKKSIWQTVAILVPFAVVAAAAMWYNNARFGSPFDFGANYNLTSNDMTARGFVMQRSWLGFFVYLFQPANVEAVFPYLTPTTTATNYLGVTIKEASYGGLFLTSLLSLFSFGVFRAKTLWQDKKTVKRLSICAFIFAFLVVLADTQMAGILIRYIPDFSWLLLLVSVFAVLQLFECASCKIAKVLKTTIVLVLVFSLGYQFFLTYTDISFIPLDFAPEHFLEAATLFEFLA